MELPFNTEEFKEMREKLYYIIKRLREGEMKKKKALKVGDKVKVVDTFYDYYKGKIGKVAKVIESKMNVNRYVVELENGQAKEFWEDQIKYIWW